MQYRITQLTDYAWRISLSECFNAVFVIHGQRYAYYYRFDQAYNSRHQVLGKGQMRLKLRSGLGY